MSSRAATRGSTFLPVVVDGRDDGVVAVRELDDQRGERLGQRMTVSRVIGEQHLLDAGKPGGGIGGGLRALTGDQDVDGGAEPAGSASAPWRWRP